MFTFFTIVFAIVWAVVSFILLFKVWDNIGPIVLSFSKSHIVQLLAMAIIFLIIVVAVTVTNIVSLKKSKKQTVKE